MRTHVSAAAVAALLLCLSTSAGAQTSGRTDRPEALLAAPSDAISYYNRSKEAQRLFAAQKWAEAETILKQLVQEYPLEGRNWGRLASAHRRQGEHAEAIAAYRKVLDLLGAGLPYDALYNIAVGQAATGDRAGALQTLEKLVFEEAFLRRPSLLQDDNFASLRGDPRFQKIAAQQDTSRLSRDAGWRRDIEHLTQEIKRNSPDYRYRPLPDEYTAAERDLLKNVPRLSDEEIFVGLGRLLNIVDHGHTRVSPFSEGGRLKVGALPLRFHAFPEGLFITQGFDGNESLAGAQVLKFGSVPAADALRLAGSAQSGESPMEVLWSGPDMLALSTTLKGLGIMKGSNAIDLTLRTPGGNVVTRSITLGDPRPLGKMKAAPGTKPPLFLARTQEMHWLQPLPESDALYVQVNNILPDKDETLPQFAASLRRAISSSNARNLILDLRHNSGGNSFMYVDLLRELIAFSTGEGRQIYVLIGRNVYSAAANLATELERLAKPIFVGEPTSGTGNQYGDPSAVRLPYSGLNASISGLRWQLSHPWDERRAIVPDVPVQLTAQAYFEGRDPALETVLKLIEASRAAPK